MNLVLKSGDIAEVTQKDGNVLQIIVHDNHIYVKANNPWTETETSQVTGYCIQVSAISKESQNKSGGGGT